MKSYTTHPLLLVTKCPESGRFVGMDYCKSRRDGGPCEAFAFVDWSRKQVVCMVPSVENESFWNQAAEAYRELIGQGGGPRGV